MTYRTPDLAPRVRELEEENRDLRDENRDLRGRRIAATIDRIITGLIVVGGITLGSVAFGYGSSCAREENDCKLACARQRGFCSFSTSREHVCALHGDGGHERERFTVPRGEP